MISTESFRSLDDWLPWLESLSPREIVLGLDRVREVLGELDLRPPPLVISVAGTNGKGSSVAMLEALLRKGGLSTGCYTSPHVFRYNERIRIDGRSADDTGIIEALRQVEKVRGDVPLTFFEFGTLAALVVFDNEKVDAWILEVGMGGRLDAVNAVEPDASLITNISLDHCAWLGEDVESIAVEKSGVMRASKPVVFGDVEIPPAIVSSARKIGAKLIAAGHEFDFEMSKSAPNSWSWRGLENSVNDLPMPPIPGRVQIKNGAAVLALIESIGMQRLLTRKNVADAFAEIHLPGRFQIVKKRCHWILDVAHNPAAGKVLAESLQGLTGRTRAVIGMLADKDVSGFIGALNEYVSDWTVVTVPATRAESAESLAQAIAAITSNPCRTADDIETAMAVVDEQSGDGDIVLVTGSFYVVGPALKWLAANG